MKIRCLERGLNSLLGFLDLARFIPIELLSQLGLVASLIQFKCTKYFRDDLTLVFEDAQCPDEKCQSPFLPELKREK